MFVAATDCHRGAHAARCGAAASRGAWAFGGTLLSYRIQWSHRTRGFDIHEHGSLEACETLAGTHPFGTAALHANNGFTSFLVCVQAKKLGVMDNEKAMVPRGAFKGVVQFRHAGVRTQANSVRHSACFEPVHALFCVQSSAIIARCSVPTIRV